MCYAPNAIAWRIRVYARIRLCVRVWVCVDFGSYWGLNVKKRQTKERNDHDDDYGGGGGVGSVDDDDVGDIQKQQVNARPLYTLYMVQVLSHVRHRPIMHRILVANSVYFGFSEFAKNSYANQNLFFFRFVLCVRPCACAMCVCVRCSSCVWSILFFCVSELSTKKIMYMSIPFHFILRSELPLLLLLLWFFLSLVRSSYLRVELCLSIYLSIYVSLFYSSLGSIAYEFSLGRIRAYKLW